MAVQGGTRIVGCLFLVTVTGCNVSPAPPTTDIVLSEWTLAAPDLLAGGEQIWSMKNAGVLLHEVLIIRTALDPAELPTSNGIVELDQITGTLIAEVAEVTPDRIVDAPITLEPGRYVLICNLPGHYQSGMSSALTVASPPPS